MNPVIFVLSNNTFRSITEDHDGNIIVATFDGISFILRRRLFCESEKSVGKDDNFRTSLFIPLY
jgi:hypothetical protein